MGSFGGRSGSTLVEEPVRTGSDHEATVGSFGGRSGSTLVEEPVRTGSDHEAIVGFFGGRSGSTLVDEPVRTGLDHKITGTGSGEMEEAGHNRAKELPRNRTTGFMSPSRPKALVKETKSPITPSSAGERTETEEKPSVETKHGGKQEEEINR